MVPLRQAKAQAWLAQSKPTSHGPVVPFGRAKAQAWLAHSKPTSHGLMVPLRQAKAQAWLAHSKPTSHGTIPATSPSWLCAQNQTLILKGTQADPNLPQRQSIRKPRNSLENNALPQVFG
jgi:hypothetical protein